MSEQKNNLSKWLHVRLKPLEYIQIHRQFSKTTCRELSDYSRKILLGKPVVSIYRNQSLDDFMAEMMLFRKELNQAGNNFNQAVKWLRSLKEIAELRGWLIAYETDQKILLNKVDQIKNHINKIADQWLQ